MLLEMPNAGIHTDCASEFSAFDWAFLLTMHMCMCSYTCKILHTIYNMFT